MPADVTRVDIDLETDLAELYALEQRVVAATPAVLDTHSTDGFLASLNAAGPVTVEGWRGPRGQLVGYLAVSGAGAVLELRSVAVDPSFQRRGLGRTIVRRAVELARLRGAARLELATAPGNEAARALYAGEGFAAVRLSTDHYGDGTDRLILAIEHP